MALARVVWIVPNAVLSIFTIDFEDFGKSKKTKSKVIM